MAYGLAGLTACGPEVPEAAPSLLLMSFDTLRADALGAYGNELETSPNLDALAAEGVVFEQAFTHSPKTAPAHLSMLTGLYPRTHRVGNLQTAGDERLSPDVPTLAERLAAEGFRTAGFTDGGNITGRLGFDRGFERFTDRHVPFTTRLTDALRWIEDEGSEAASWFAFVHTYAIHDPYLPAARFRDRFVSSGYQGELTGDREELERRIANGDDRAPNVSPGRKLVSNFWRRQALQSPEDYAYLHQLYLAGVAQADAEWGRFLRRFDGLEDAASTFVVATSDHGEEFGEHGRTRHDQLYEEVLRVPLLLRAPDRLWAGRRVEFAVRHVDLVPSLLELLGISGPKAPGLIQGRSWAGALGQAAPLESDRPVFAEHRSLRDNDLDLWVLREGQRSVHLSREGRQAFELGEDPQERFALEREPDWAGPLALEVEQRIARLSAASAQLRVSKAVGATSERTQQELEMLGYMEEP